MEDITENDIQPLYTTSHEKKVSKRDFVAALNQLDIHESDILFVHSDITTFGALATKDRNLLLTSLTDSFKEVVGNTGTIIMPTFTYSPDHHEAYNKDHSKSTVGVLTEFFRTQTGVSRTNHPTHSAAVWGKNKDFFLDIGKNTFDEQSVFGKMHSKFGKMVFLGTPFHKACTFIHYVEKKHSVPYRYVKKYKAKIIEGSSAREEQQYSYYKYSFFFTDMVRLEEYLKEKKILKEVSVGDGFIQVIDCDDLVHAGKDLLSEDTFFFLRNDSYFKTFNMMILPFLKFTPWLVKLLDLIAGPIIRKKS